MQQKSSVSRWVLMSAVAAAGLFLSSQSALAACQSCAAGIQLPSTKVHVDLEFGEDVGVNAFFRATLSNVPAGFAITNGAYLAWCADNAITPVFTPQDATPYSTYSPNLPAGSQNANWPKVNYVLNHKLGTRDDIQLAIWQLLTGNVGSNSMTPLATQMVNEANLYGTYFLPAPGQVLGVLLFFDGFGGGAQDILIEVT